MFSEIIRKAQERLVRHPFDALHGIEHHTNTWKNCLLIINKEKLKVDKSYLKIAAWWHDVERNEDACLLLRKSMSDLKFNDEAIEKVVAIINGHSYGRKQGNLESKILYDADKLEYVSEKRIETLSNLHKKGVIKDEKFTQYKKAWAERINNVKGNLHFSSSKELFNKKLAALVKHTKTNSFLADMVEAVI
jgi:HD superfamily phosphodiesterase